MHEPVSLYIGFDPREAGAFAVAKWSARRTLNSPVPVYGLILPELRKAGLYKRPTLVQSGRLYDVISEHPMSTEFAISRFLTPIIAQKGWALFTDCDVLFRSDFTRMFDEIEPGKAVYVVKHRHEPEPGIKMDGQMQSRYARKNWSSVMLFNCNHPANKKLTVEMINEVPGRDLHRFCWLKDGDIGELHPKWNWLVGNSNPLDDQEPCIVHFTDGLPVMRGYETSEYAQEWFDALGQWAHGPRMPGEITISLKSDQQAV